MKNSPRVSQSEKRFKVRQSRGQGRPVGLPRKGQSALTPAAPALSTQPIIFTLGSFAAEMTGYLFSVGSLGWLLLLPAAFGRYSIL